MIFQKQIYHQNYKEGAYGTVFFDTLNCFAYKVFLKKIDRSYEFSKNVYDSEVHAYLLSQKNNKISDYVPKFYGHVEIEKIIDVQGRDISSHYYPCLNYKMEYISDKFIDFSQIDEDQQKEYIKLFGENGINHVIDSAVTINTEGRIQKMIDFAAQEFIPQW